MWNVDRLIDRAGDWNAQLFRELKGRVTFRNIFLAGGLSIGSQILLLSTFLLQLPTEPKPGASRSSQTYCVLETIKTSNGNGGFYDEKVCQLNALGQVSTDWPHWWASILLAISWLLPVLLITGGVYLLAKDLYQETKRGTLNFVRLSPQSAAEIFRGKLLGVPILIFLAVAVALPLHFLAALGSGFGLLNAGAWYALIAAIATVFYIAAMFLTLASPAVPIAISGLALWLSSSLLSLINWLLDTAVGHDAWRSSIPQLHWFYLPITQNLFSFYIFGIGNCLIAIYWLWQSVCRYYQNPHGTLLAKKSSYQLNICMQLWLVGFGLPLFTGSHSLSDLVVFLGCVFVCQIGAALVAIGLLTPQRQAIHDWSRYRRTSERKQLWRRDIWQDLWGNDQSPAILALAVNMGIALVVWLPWCPFAFTNGYIALKTGISVVISAVLLLNYGLLIQMWLITKKKWPQQQALAFITPLVILPSSFAMLAAIIGMQSIASLILAIASPLAVFGASQISWLQMLSGAAIQSLVSVLAIASLQRQIHKIGQSETKTFLNAI
jgi:hypothetical protein